MCFIYVKIIFTAITMQDKATYGLNRSPGKTLKIRKRLIIMQYILPILEAFQNSPKILR